MIRLQWIREPTDAELDSLLARPEKIQQMRRCLSSLSWLMARWFVRHEFIQAFCEQASRFAAQSESFANLTAEEKTALDEFMRVLISDS